jgi:hypothetical protein
VLVSAEILQVFCRSSLSVDSGVVQRLWLAVVLGPLWEDIVLTRWPLFGLFLLLENKHRSKTAPIGNCCEEPPCSSDLALVYLWLRTRGFFDGVLVNDTSWMSEAANEEHVFHVRKLRECSSFKDSH